MSKLRDIETKWEDFTHKMWKKFYDGFGYKIHAGSIKASHATKSFIDNTKTKLSPKKADSGKTDSLPFKTAEELLAGFGGKENISSFTNCMTRLRVKVNDKSKVNEDALKSQKKSLGVAIAGEEYQVILGPGFVLKVANAFGQLTDAQRGAEIKEEVKEDAGLDISKASLEEIAAANKKARKAKNTSAIQRFLAKFAKIFTPMIFGFIGAGILGGIAGIIQSVASTPAGNGVDRVWESAMAESWHLWLNFFIEGWKGAFIIIVGWRTASVFGASGVIGAIASIVYVSQFGGLATGMYVSEMTDGAVQLSDGTTVYEYVSAVNFLGIKIDPLAIEDHWLAVGFDPSIQTGILKDGSNQEVVVSVSYAYARGAVFGAMMIAGIGVPIEKKIREYMPGTIDMVVSPLLTLFILLFFNFFLIVPISGYMFMAVAWLFETLSTSMAGSAFLGSIFLLTVVFGIHQGFVPVYAALIQTTGVNSLFPILAMAGAGQVGVGIALFLKAEKGALIRNQIKGTIIPAIMGIGEPMIYGITLPRPRTFVASMFGGFFGGLMMGAFNSGDTIIGLNSQFGPSGLLALPMMTTAAKSTAVVTNNLAYAMGGYATSLVTAYFAGFLWTYIIGTRGVDLS